jgi:hypothetical protein
MCLHVNVNLPADIEARLRREVADLEASARESFLIDLFRQGKLSHHELGTALGLDRFQTDGLLKRRGVREGMITHEEVSADVRTLRRLLDKPGQ